MNLNSKIIRIVLAVIVVLAGMMAYYASNGKTINGLQNAAGTAAKPAQEATSTVSGGISNLFQNIFGESATQRENDELRREINELRKKQVSYDRILQENEEYKKMSISEFTKAAGRYESNHAGIYEMCKKDYPDILEELEKEPFNDLLDAGCGPVHVWKFGVF